MLGEANSSFLTLFTLMIIGTTKNRALYEPDKR
jgi:hypothetical protein